MKKIFLGLSLLFCLSSFCEAVSKYKIIVSTKSTDIGYTIKGSQKYEIMADSGSTPIVTISSYTVNFGSLFAGADNLGNHIATTTINMNGWDIINMSSITLSGRAQVQNVQIGAGSNYGTNKDIILGQNGGSHLSGGGLYFNTGYGQKYITDTTTGLDLRSFKGSDAVGDFNILNSNVYFNHLSTITFDGVFHGNGSGLLSINPINISAGALNSVTSLTASSITVTGMATLSSATVSGNIILQIGRSIRDSANRSMIRSPSDDYLNIGEDFTYTKIGNLTKRLGLGIAASDSYKIEVGDGVHFNFGFITTTMTARGICLASNIQSADYVITSTDTYIYVNCTSGNKTITLPNSTGSGQIFTIKKIDNSAYTITVNCTGAGTIDGDSTLTIESQWSSISFQDASTNIWYMH